MYVDGNSVTYFDTNITEIDNKIPSVTGLVTTDALNIKVTEIKNKIAGNTDLATKSTLGWQEAEVENKIPDVTNLAKKSAFNPRAPEIENKIHDSTGFITIVKLTKISFHARMKETTKLLANKSKIDNALNVVD